MTEYWQSTARKYCEFCKCWFADSKVCISFHENGKRHKENVQKHISQLSKKSAKEFKQKEKIDDEMKKMEAAAMAAYLKDVKNNGDLTSKVINEMVEKSGGSAADITVSCSTKDKSAYEWHEIKSDSGSSYFWNTKTNETTWNAPDNYLSIVKQEEKKLKEEQPEKKQKKPKKSKQEACFKEVEALMKREKMKEMSDKTKPRNSDDQYGPSRPTNPYGSWKPVVDECQESIDLQLPKSGKQKPPPPVLVLPEVVQFKEKRVDSLGDGPVDFKKRKLNVQKRNIRQKLDDE
ncbi:PREDICTED: WW domain-binding protein 4 [Papilio polytes]|uniref:WW domain-binding protein 4 n=1 Tax=Papilio polytes TaxID=76194 RepID=UPI000675C098|nr:PREDICTED: WW domain-binding protein 4 [Papilio polytes]